MNAFDTTKASIDFILMNAQQFHWTIQGLGMLRLNFTKTLRLHVWDREGSGNGATPMHTHPWDFTSHVIAGVVEQYRFREVDPADALPSSMYYRYRVQCGPGGGIVGGDPTVVHLHCLPLETYMPGHVYHHLAEEIHHSIPENGTVTLVERRFRKDTEHADVFVPMGQEFVSAETRDATPDEISRITGNALRRWF